MQKGMSALPPKADMCGALAHVCFVPIADYAPQQSALYSITSSARASKRRRHGEAERLGGLEIDHQLVLGRSLDRQIGRLLALEDAIDVSGRRRNCSIISGP